MPDIDNINKILLNNIQINFPIDSRPFQIVAVKLGLTEEEVINRIRQMKEEMLIRRIGGNFSPDKLGYYSTLCAARVPEEKIDFFTKTVNSYSGVTHNYQRDHGYNIWFTFIAPSVAIIEKSLKDISDATQVEPILNLPATKVFKISANFKV